MLPLPIAHTPKSKMTSDHAALGQIRVAKPCHADWNAMTGDDRSRFCGQCEKHVYNLSAMTTAEASALVREKEGKLCVRYYLRADGTMLTQDCPVGVATAQRRASRKVAAAIVGITAAVWTITDAVRLTNGYPPLIVERVQYWADQMSPMSTQNAISEPPLVDPADEPPLPVLPEPPPVVEMHPVVMGYAGRIPEPPRPAVVLPDSGSHISAGAQLGTHGVK